MSTEQTRFEMGAEFDEFLSNDRTFRGEWESRDE
jgi:hypothetical protein